MLSSKLQLVLNITFLRSEVLLTFHLISELLGSNRTLRLFKITSYIFLGLEIVYETGNYLESLLSRLSVIPFIAALLIFVLIVNEEKYFLLGIGCHIANDERGASACKI